MEVDPAKRREEHGEVECQRVHGAVQLLVVHDALFDAGDVGTGNGPDPPLAEQRLGPQLRRGLEALLGEGEPAHAEIAELVLVGQVHDVGQVAHPGLAYLVLDVEGVLEGGALARACPVAHAHDQGLLLALLHLGDRCLECGGCLDSVARGAHGLRVAVRTQAWRGPEVELGSGGVDQVVVGQFAVLTRAIRIRIGQLDIGGVVRRIALGVDGRGQGLLVADPFALVDRSELERHLLGLHLADADPDVGWDPVPLRVRGDHQHLVGPLEHPREVEGGSMAGDPSAQDYDSCHVTPPSRAFLSPYLIPPRVSSTNSG